MRRSERVLCTKLQGMGNSAAMKRLLIATVALLGACGSEDVPGTCKLNFAGPVNAAFGNVSLDALIEASARFGVAARDIDSSVRGACNAINTGLGAQTSDDTATACDNAAAAIDAVLAANPSVTVTIEYVPPVCAASASAIVECTAACDASFDASATPPTCEGGELSGGCSGECSGTCTVEGSATCTGSCSATCSGQCDATITGTCEGTCNGQCDGTCSAMGGDGNCAGTCDGTCRGTCSGAVEGTCSGTCEGSCSGSCRAEVTGECTGTCSGSCDVAFTEPRCEGGELSVMADADCSAACEADSSFDIECTEPVVVVTFTGVPVAALDVAALVTVLEDNLGTLLAAAAQAEIVLSATAEFATRLGGATAAAAEAGVEAADCLRIAIETQVAATASISVSIEASASVSASASGSGGT